MIEVLDIRREYDLGNERLVMLLAELQERYHADCLISEANVLKAQQRDSNWAFLRNLFQYVIAHNTGMNKSDEQLGAAMYRSLWEFGRLRLPWGDGLEELRTVADSGTGAISCPLWRRVLPR